ncbi:hypothetical protein [Porticoccus sp.]
MSAYQSRYLGFIRDLVLSSLWLLFLAVLNRKSSVPIVSILPYLFPVVVVSWRYGLGWGFLFAALGTLAAMPGDYLKEHQMKDLYWAAFTTYLKLTTVAVGIIWGRKIGHRRKGRN